MAKPLVYLSIVLIGTPLFAAENGFTYLALGDSVPFGMNVSLLPPYSNTKPSPSEFVGYPETVASIDRILGMTTLLNAGCPGETSGSFLNTAMLDNGCNSPHVQPPFAPVPPFKTTYGLHVAYTGSQMTYAVAQLQSNHNIGLVTLSIGANDVLLALPALEACGSDTTCAQNVLTPVLGTYSVNLANILSQIRSVYQGRLILMTYYSPEAALDTVTQALNSAMTAVGNQFPHITYADGYDAFQAASAPFNHDPCQAGLLIKLPPEPYNTSPCDIHPSPLGRTILAATVEFAALRAQ